ncbi:hypothetical protein NWP22_05520 [Anabaenopsis tanganyikae CS-531]|uniref:Uncharacterized protein n=2 Tax=Anabaenopsis TaxID=110103 RepID=A0ABT6KC52_9CYAN|nr:MULTISPECIES: hypothetical protein [Anabaenopsis]MDB9539914.1 hypothetical protein [Anabaenopsis arnoldii]MDH6092218.1 hypothetical protein [Anabaenopsis arnoldii]MDH6105331.1 hypothetical protein [Anabaenopsis tanganyikae CS-531]
MRAAVIGDRPRLKVPITTSGVENPAHLKSPHHHRTDPKQINLNQNGVKFTFNAT